MDAIEMLRRAAEIPADSVTLTLSREDLSILVEKLDALDCLQSEARRREDERYPEFRPANGHWYVEDGRQVCLGEIADLDVARVRVALQRAHSEVCAAVGKLTAQGRWYTHSELVDAMLDAVARWYVKEAV